MRKRSTRRPRSATPPMLVSRGMIDQDLELRERMIVEAFSGGWAGEQHFNELADMHNVVTLAAARKDDERALAMCDAMRVPLANLRQRYAVNKRMGVTGDELRMLRAFVEFYRDFWLRQPVSSYINACDDLNRAHAMGVVKEAA